MLNNMGGGQKAKPKTVQGAWSFASLPMPSQSDAGKGQTSQFGAVPQPSSTSSSAAQQPIRQSQFC
ncbi:MAG TPA: hypothetical protein PKI93_02860 [Alphaproteobacteria bacterium]|nr:hypothetical protein [Alphaproteobacteria bacterium]HNS43919.1 hypothetical protein [Alphaproteobacteria bacterium]